MTNWYRPIRRSTPRRVAMKVRLTAAAGLVVLLSLAMASATGARIAEPQARQATDITVWLMVDAQSNWPEAVAAANQAFGAEAPGRERQGAVPDLGRLQDEVRSDARRRQRARRDRVRQHRHAEVHGGRSARTARQGETSRTRARGCPVSPRRASTTARRSPSRTTPVLAASSTGPTSTRRRGSRAPRSRWPSSRPPARS